jgi:molybdopterin/thiamine biosynthesis adenylyltransferase/rhodanese-related sulfurtransferase
MVNKSFSELEISVLEADRLANRDRPVIDIRSERSRQAGVPAGAVVMSPEELRRQLAGGAGTSSFSGGFVMCDRGISSLDLVRRLRLEGIGDVHSVAGGYAAWLQAGLPVDYPDGLDAVQAERYARHLVMPQVGPRGQVKLLGSRVLLVGLGGLNSPAALYLAAAGIGALGLADDDTVERSNLQRQIIHSEEFLGEKKVESAQRQIRKLNPEVDTRVYDVRIDEANVESIIESWDVVIYGTDSFPARYALNEACVALNKPLVYGAVMRFQGQVSVFWPAAGQNFADRPCYRCLFPAAPSARDAPNCAEAGVLGVLPGIVGTLQASETLKLLLGIGKPLIGRLLLFDALNMDFREARIAANLQCPTCGEQPEA